MKEKSCAYGSSGGLRRAGWTLTGGGTGGKGVGALMSTILWFVEAHLG